MTRFELAIMVSLSLVFFKTFTSITMADKNNHFTLENAGTVTQMCTGCLVSQIVRFLVAGRPLHSEGPFNITCLIW